MTNGPPSSQAGPSQPPASAPSTGTVDPATQRPPYYPQAALQNTTQLSAASTTLANPTQYAQTQAQGQVQGQASTQGYYTVSYPPGTWQNAWPVAGYPYASGSAPYQQHYSQIPYTQYQSQQYAVQYQPPARPKPKPAPPPPPPKHKTPSPSPPPPEFHRHWDGVIRSFLKKVGLTQALRGFEDDMVVMNPDWERRKVPGAIGELMRDLLTLGKSEDGEEPRERPLEERKLDYVRVAGGGEPRSQTSVIKSISAFLAQNRARNDASNRVEFLESLSQKRRRLQLDEDSTEPIPSCARADAKHLDRDVQMKYDIAKNEDGPLRRTMKGTAKGKQPPTQASLSEDALSEDQPAVDERVKNIETHLAVRYVPGPPSTLAGRLKFLEDHIVHLEKEYPPWAALHFNQPNRGWPPPPRPTPIIVPSHITSKNTAADASVTPTSSINAGVPDDPGKVKNKNKSSLHRAVMEKLEVQKAMTDLAGRGKTG